VKDRRVVFVLLVALAAISLRPSTDAAAGARKRCFPHGSRTVVKDRVARVYRIVYRGSREVWGCSYRTGRRTFLGLRDFSNFEGEYAAPIVLRGPFVAVNVKEAGHSTGTYATVSVFDLRSRKRLHVWSQGGTACDGDTEVNELRLTGSGAAAWIAEAQFGCDPTIKQVFKADRSSRHVRELDYGDSVDAHYLRLTRKRVSWKHDGETRSAPVR
jgi:hypothetical protein